MDIIASLQKLTQLAIASAEVVDALNAIREGYSDEEYEQIEVQYPLIAAIVSAAADLEHALQNDESPHEEH